MKTRCVNFEVLFFLVDCTSWFHIKYMHGPVSPLLSCPVLSSPLLSSPLLSSHLISSHLISSPLLSSPPSSLYFIWFVWVCFSFSWLVYLEFMAVSFYVNLKESFCEWRKLIGNTIQNNEAGILIAVNSERIEKGLYNKVQLVCIYLCIQRIEMKRRYITRKYVFICEIRW